MWQTIAGVVSRATLGDWMLLASGIFLILYIVGTRNYDYFQKRGIASTKPKIPFLGDMAAVFLGSRSFPELLKDQYKQSDGHGVFGNFEFTKPVYLIRDPEILKVIAVKEFDSFMNHRTLDIQKIDPIISKNLFNLKDQAWRDMRATLSPAFTTSKIKGMFPLISECGKQMAEHLRQKYSESKEGTLKKPLPTDMKDVFSRLANDVIATAAFGVSCDSLKNPENEFYQMGKTITTFSKLKTMIFLAIMMFPKLMQIFRVSILDKKATTFFDSLVHEMIRERQKKSIFRPDVVQLLMQAREGQLKTEAEDSAETEEVGARKTKLSDDDVSAQAMIFFFAGFETESTVLSLFSYAISHYKDAQKGVQKEIEEVLQKTGGKVTYESVQSMKYLDAVINEVLRMYPPAMSTDRQCQKDTQIPAGETSVPFTICKGQVIGIPILGLHYDPKFWDEPEKFNPERFSDENKHNISPYVYMPFGVGPRLCIGQRFALIEVKLALVHLLANFDVHPCSKTKHPIEFERGMNVIAKGGFWCELVPREVQEK